MLKENLSIIARTLVRYGFQRIPGRDPCFEGLIKARGLEFGIRITAIDPSFLKLPIATLVSRPKSLEGLLPHIEKNKTLCYLERLGIFLDPLEPARTTLMVIGAIKSLLESYFDEDHITADFADEFVAYWEGQYKCCLITDQQIGVSKLVEVKDIQGNKIPEYVVAHDQEGLQDWCGRRKADLPDQKKTGTAITLTITEPPQVENDKPWPPQRWPNFLDWLKTKHPNLERQLLQALLGVTKEQTSTAIIIRSDQSGPFGVYVRFSQELIKISERFRPRRPQKTKRKKSKDPLTRFRQTVRNQLLVKKFFRLHVVDVTEQFVYERNLLTKSLRNREIAVLGCGTIGGFAANLLIKAGAGTGNKGMLDLYDEDTLSGANLGRHLLGVEYLFESKGAAMADYLNTAAMHPVSIQGFPNYTLGDLNRISHYDLVINATGEETFSTLLSHGLHISRKQGKKVPPLLHTWIDAGGRAIRGLIDDGSGACYRCLQIKKPGGQSGELTERYPLFKSSDEEASAEIIHHRCGESFYPFAAGVSSAAAGMVQQMALDALQQNPGARFRHQSLDSSIQNTKDGNPQKIKGCPCCNLK